MGHRCRFGKGTDLVGPAARIGDLPARNRRLLVAGLFVFAAAVIVASAEPFAHSLITVGTQLGIDKFLLVQWVAPLASEAPEFIVAILLAVHGKGSDAISTCHPEEDARTRTGILV